MCILCVIQKWSRQVATMLPWFVVPLIGLWALSQLLPPAFRFEITSPRLACVFVLLVTLFWYEVLMPQLSTWRVRRNARLRERERLQAIEMQKLKKNATRRCRNCSAPYKDQNPGGGKFMCSYCGHVSKRPVLDMPISSGLEISGSGILKDLVGRGGKLLNGKGCSEDGYLHRQEWSESSTWNSGSNYWWNNNGCTFEGDENCLVDKSYSGGVVFACQLLPSLFMSISWLWRKIFRFSSSFYDSSLDPEQRRLLARQGENGTSYHESRVEKARRKAEEKRQAKLEKELSEEEERKQREEVARLVEERRKLRDEKIEAEKCSKLSQAGKAKDTKEAKKKRQERKKESDRTSSKSNSDGEEVDKKIRKETRQKRFLDQSDHLEHERHAPDSVRGPNMARVHGYCLENNGASNSTKYSGRYFDRMKGTFFSSSKAFSDSRLFGRGVNTSATIAKENKDIGSADNSQTYAHSSHISPPESVTMKSVPNGGEGSINNPVVSEPKPSREPRKSWHQLFACPTPVPVSSNVKTISRPITKPQPTVQSSQVPSQVSSIRTFGNPISFGLPSPFTIPVYDSRSTTSSLGFSPPTENLFPHPGEDERFEDPCYVPDPISLLGPVSKSLDSRAAGYETGVGLVQHHAMKNTATCEVNKPSPIESPLSRSRAADEKHANDRSWQMWKSPLGQNGIGFGGGTANWIIPSETTKFDEGSAMHHIPQHRTASLFVKEDCELHQGVYSHRKDCLENDQRSGFFSPITGPTTPTDPWSQNMFSPALSGIESPFSFSTQTESVLNNVAASRSPSKSARDNPFEHPSPNHWITKVKSSGDGNGKQFVVTCEVENHQEDVFNGDFEFLLKRSYSSDGYSTHNDNQVKRSYTSFGDVFSSLGNLETS